ncbi:ABC transporter [Sinomonas atrocyanea]|uniref:ABC transporter n=1 Tax=Sinomonas atrocyanea TaxID=37927 RepID=A0A126ZZR5_9MICC|nr:ABC transporter permease [Sinomonas atrocyanea]AMM32054.1 ABC transporter [Sinomonas atrocyanea]GEB65224.1 transport permease protein [Sinomonas atrocyanea]GGG56215.1 transport permease protein [Sinomonas atrocyanea]
MTDAARTRLAAHAPEVSAAKARRWGSFYFAEHVLRSMRAYLVTIVVTSVGNPLLYLFSMGVGLASIVDRSAGGAHGVFGGVGYLAFAAPALLVSSAVMTSANEMMFPVMDGFKWRRFYYGPHVTPLVPGQLAAGHIMAVGVRLTLQCLVFFLIMLAFGAAPGPWAWLLVPIGVFAGMAFGAPLMAYSAHIESENFQFSMIQRFIVMPLFLFSGTFYPLATMPVGMQWIGWISPLWHGNELGRMASYGLSEPGWLVAVHVLYLGALGAVGIWWARRNYAKRMGK